MACPDCFKNCGDRYTSDRCVEYTGEDIPALGITKGCPLTVVEQAVIESLLSVIEGTGITLADVTLENCEWLKNQFVGKNKNLVTILQLLIDSQCTLKELIDQEINSIFVFDTQCLTGLPANPDRDDILQSAINLLCQHDTKINELDSTYVKLSDLTTQVLQIIAANPSLVGIPKLCPIPYVGTLGNFDGSGKGIIGEYVGWYICNGQNGTPDWRGRKVVGAVRSVPGGALDTAVDPAIQGAAVNYGVGDKFGLPFVKLATTEIPAHSHPVTDPGHSHNLSIWNNDSSGGSQTNTAYLNSDNGAVPKNVPTSPNATGITIGSAGGSQAHENRDPSVAAVWIVKL